jgi:predicted metal-dependent HD superfamily phosphohydrolase
LLARWAEPHRVYHVTAHLAAVLDHLDELAAAGEAVADAARLAAWWHDAVYDPRRDDNEARSADLAAPSLAALGVRSDTVADVARLVRLTAGHRSLTGDVAGAALCDADLAVLGSPGRGYRAYAAAIRLEYGHLSDEAFHAGRTAVLHDLLGRPALYATATGRQRWEAPARRNMEAELSALGS